MKIWLSDAGKRFNRDWIFRHLTFSFETGNTYAIVGPNGSGKSTLLQLIAGAIDITEGKIKWELNGKQIDDGKVFTELSICAPYLEVIEEMTAVEFLNFHSRFKPLLNDLSASFILSTIGLQQAANKQIRYYSSGMKQRIKLAQAIFSNTALVLLDEPCTNLDESGYELYYSLIDNYCKGRLVVVSSNDAKEYHFCRERINITDWKNALQS